MVKDFVKAISRLVNGTRDGGQSFKFLDPGVLQDDDLELHLVRTLHGRTYGEEVATYRFLMRKPGVKDEIGRIDLRIGDTERIQLYLGHIGYRVFSAYRGNRYAARACRLLLPLARAHGINELWITCNPDNLASRRTCELIGAELIEVVDVPEGTDFYRAGELQKCRYLLDLNL